MQQKQGGQRKALDPLTARQGTLQRQSLPETTLLTCAGIETKMALLSQLIEDTKIAVELLAQANKGRLENDKLKKSERYIVRANNTAYGLLIDLLEINHIKDFFQNKDARSRDSAEEFLKIKIISCAKNFTNGEFSNLNCILSFKSALFNAISSTKQRISGGINPRLFGEEQFDNFIAAFTILHKTFCQK